MAVVSQWKSQGITEICISQRIIQHVFLGRSKPLHWHVSTSVNRALNMQITDEDM